MSKCAMVRSFDIHNLYSVYTLINSPSELVQESHSYLLPVFSLISLILTPVEPHLYTPCLIVATVVGTHFPYPAILLIDVYVQQWKIIVWIYRYGIEAASACRCITPYILKKNMWMCACGYRVLENFDSSNMGRTPPRPRSQSAEVHKPLTHRKRQRKVFMSITFSCPITSPSSHHF